MSPVIADTDSADRAAGGRPRRLGAGEDLLRRTAGQDPLAGGSPVPAPPTQVTTAHRAFLPVAAGDVALSHQLPDLTGCRPQRLGQLPDAAGRRASPPRLQSDDRRSRTRHSADPGLYEQHHLTRFRITNEPTRSATLVVLIDPGPGSLSRRRESPSWSGWCPVPVAVTLLASRPCWPGCCGPHLVTARWAATTDEPPADLLR